MELLTQSAEANFLAETFSGVCGRLIMPVAFAMT
jgi:hypothetical protein